MNYKKSLLTALAVPFLCLSRTPPPFQVECRLLDRISTVAASESSGSDLAIAVLQQVALGSPVTGASELEAKIEARPGQLQRQEFKSTTVRAHALRNIGRLGGPEAIDFLSKLSPANLGPDDSQRIWPAAQIALQEALLNQVPDAHRKVEFLEKAVKDPPGDRMSRGHVRWWAITELCDGGSAKSLSVIQETITSLGSSTGPDQIQFCEDRIQVLQRDPNRVKALGSVLRVDNWYSKRLTSWAMYKLDAMQSPEADAELDRFAAEITELPEGSSAKRRMVGYANEIRYLQSERPLRTPRPPGRLNP